MYTKHWCTGNIETVIFYGEKPNTFRKMPAVLLLYQTILQLTRDNYYLKLNS